MGVLDVDIQQRFAVEGAGFGCDGECEGAAVGVGEERAQGTVKGTEADGIERNRAQAVRQAEFEVLLRGSHRFAEGDARVGECEHGLRVARAEGGELLHAADQRVGEAGAGGGGIDGEARGEALLQRQVGVFGAGGELFEQRLVEFGAEGGEVMAFQRDACGHGVAATGEQRAMRSVDGGADVEAVDAAARALEVALGIGTQNEGGAIELLLDA